MAGNRTIPSKDPDQLDTIPHERSEPRPDFRDDPIPRQKLPPALQKAMDDTSDPTSWWDTIASGDGGETTDSSVRYAAYAARLRTIMLSAQRYVAYTSDIGESFRPVAHPNLVRAAYGISWAYLAGDVGYEGYKAWKRNEEVRSSWATSESKGEGVAASQTTESKTTPSSATPPPIIARPGGQHIAAIDDYRAVMAQRAVFQSIASMGLPAFTIHSIVRYSGRAMKNVKSPRIRTWGPIGLGLAAVPALPFLFDKPVEHATEWVFHKAFETIGGPSAVGKDADGRGAGLPERNREKKEL